MKSLQNDKNTEEETEETALDFLSKIGINHIPVEKNLQTCSYVVKQEIISLMDVLKVTNDIQHVEVF